MAVTMKNAVLWDVTPCGSCKNRRSGECIVSIIRITRIGKLGTMLILVTLMMDATHSFEMSVLTRSTWRNITEDSSSFLQTVSEYEGLMTSVVYITVAFFHMYKLHPEFGMLILLQNV
jgi:hypothetical protein